MVFFFFFFTGEPVYPRVCLYSLCMCFCACMYVDVCVCREREGRGGGVESSHLLILLVISSVLLIMAWSCVLGEGHSLLTSQSALLITLFICNNLQSNFTQWYQWYTGWKLTYLSTCQTESDCSDCFFWLVSEANSHMLPAFSEWLLLILGPVNIIIISFYTCTKDVLWCIHL